MGRVRDAWTRGRLCDGWGRVELCVDGQGRREVVGAGGGLHIERKVVVLGVNYAEA